MSGAYALVVIFRTISTLWVVSHEKLRLRALYDAGELCYGDLETACSDLGLEYDYAEYFLAAIAR